MIKLKCPECGYRMSLASIKPGKYRPKCKKCDKSFSLRVSNDDPPKVTLGRFRKVARSDGDSNIATQANAVDATLDSGSTDVSHDRGPSAEAPTVAVLPSPSIAAATQQTRDDLNSNQSADQTTDGSVPKQRPSVGSVVSPGSPSGKVVIADGAPSRLGGYRIIRQLGAGAMGKVYEAKQISLDRPVALKTIKPSLASNASSLARFTREAYAAAQMTHHNVVQIFDFGQDSGQHFFSMEWVRGGPLDELVRRKGSLDPRLAASYTLQAARGLQSAHAAGMIHRDIKPANLLLTDQGVIKVADLGLVKIADLPEPSPDDSAPSTALASAASGTDMTMHGTAVGTPAYMSPEQATDAATVDHRADIYSLGCTLFYFLCGRAPFPGSKVSQVIDAHIRAPIPDASEIRPSVPAELADIIKRCLAKRPSGRYQTISEMIGDLELYLDIRGDDKFSPTAQQADAWSTMAKSYAKATSVWRLRQPMIFLGIAVAAIIFLLTPWLGLSMLLFAPVAILTASIALALLQSIAPEPRQPSPVTVSIRRWAATLSWPGWLLGLFSMLVILVLALAAGWWLGLLLGVLAGTVFANLYHFVLVVPGHKKAMPIVESAKKFVRDLRLAGTDEDAITKFAARQGSTRWRGLFNHVFGYEAANQMRIAMANDRTFEGRTSETWEDRLVSHFDRRTAANRKISDAAKLAKVEKSGLRAEGLSAAEASQRSVAIAEAWIEQSQLLEAGRRGSLSSDHDEAAIAEKRKRIKAMLEDARSGRYKTKRDPLAIPKRFLGGQTRLAAGLMLLTVFAIWGKSSGLFDSIAEIDVAAVAAGDLASVHSAAESTAAVASVQMTSDIPKAASGTSVWSIAVAGLLLSLSAFVSGWRMTPFAIVATIVILWGANFGLPAIAGFPAWATASAAGMIVYLPGLFVGDR